jgi:hypothetical protein
MLALPALWYGSLTMLLAVIPLLDGVRDGRPPARADDGRDDGPAGEATASA